MAGSIRTRRDGNVCTITLEQGGKRNAISYPMMEDLRDVLESLDDEAENSVLVLRGAGEKAFSAGFDLSQERRESFDAWNDMIAALADYDYPTIAMVDGDAFGGGVHIAMTCDLRIGRPSARVGFPEATLGIVYAPDAIERLVALVGPATAKELLFTGEPIDAETAHGIGLLNHLVEADELGAFTYGLAETIGDNAPFSLTSMKSIVDAIVERGTLGSEEQEWAASLRAEAFETRAFEDGRRAFAEDREPEFEGR